MLSVSLPNDQAPTAVWQDVDGKEIIDFVTMFSATNIGHGHPKLIEAVVDTMRKGTYLQSPGISFQPMDLITSQLSSYSCEHVYSLRRMANLS